MPRFVILEHNHPELHWDFMLEAGQILRTWKLHAPPSVEANVSAESSFDHRLLYLDYEGPISGNRGSVLRWDHGVYSWQSETPDRLIIQLDGKKCCGLAMLTKQADGSWQLEISNDKNKL